jgi:hypothetical protein
MSALNPLESSAVHNSFLIRDQPWYKHYSSPEIRLLLRSNDVSTLEQQLQIMESIRQVEAFKAVYLQDAVEKRLQDLERPDSEQLLRVMEEVQRTIEVVLNDVITKFRSILSPGRLMQCYDIIQEIISHLDKPWLYGRSSPYGTDLRNGPPLELALVSRTWRNVVYTMPLGWNSIKLVCGNAYPTSLIRVLTSHLATGLERSGSCALDIEIISSRDLGTSSEWWHWSDCFQVLCAQSSRWRNLEIIVQGSMNDFSFILDRTQGAVEALKSLTLQCEFASLNHNDVSQPLCEGPFFGGCLSLQEVCFDGFSLPLALTVAGWLQNAQKFCFVVQRQQLTVDVEPWGLFRGTMEKIMNFIQARWTYRRGGHRMIKFHIDFGPTIDETQVKTIVTGTLWKLESYSARLKQWKEEGLDLRLFDGAESHSILLIVTLIDFCLQTAYLWIKRFVYGILVVRCAYLPE